MILPYTDSAYCQVRALQISSLECGKPWTKGDGDNIEEPNQRCKETKGGQTTGKRGCLKQLCSRHPVSSAKDELLTVIHEKLKAGIYRFKPARRVLIPKEGSAKMRKLGIPVVMDRVVSQSTNLVFQEIFEPDFSRSNYGFRRGHSQRQAIYHVQMIVKEGYEWFVSIDLARFFDEIPHNLMLKPARRKIADERLVSLDT